MNTQAWRNDKGTATVYILVRFNHYAPLNFPDLGLDASAMQRYLWSRERVEYRLALFEHVTLKSLRHQSDQNFKILLLTGEAMPETVEKRVHDLMHGFNYTLRRAAPAPQDRLYAQWLDELHGNAKPRIMMRLDDDDAISTDWVRIIRVVATQFDGVADGGNGVAIAPSHGIIFDVAGDDPEIIPVFARTPCSVGLTIISPLDSDITPFRFQHQKIGRHLPLISLPDRYGFLRLLHQSNISRGIDRKPMRAFDKAGDDPLAALYALETHFGIDIDGFALPNYDDPHLA